MEAGAAPVYAGGCLCGGVRYRAEGRPVNERVCHCRLCQRAIGAAFNARLLFNSTDVAVEGAFAWHPSSDAVDRGFCTRCGTTLFSARPGAGSLAVTAGSLDDPGQFRPSMQIWTASRQPWVRLLDTLPAHEGAAPAG